MLQRGFRRLKTPMLEQFQPGLKGPRTRGARGTLEQFQPGLQGFAFITIRIDLRLDRACVLDGT